jgi:hypothetical protein
MSDENIPLKILKSMNTIERQNLNGEYKKEIVKQGILNNNNEINTEKLVEDLIELLIDITKKKVKLLINSNKKCF